MKTKKILAALIASVMLLTACSGGEAVNKETDEGSEAETTAESSVETDETTEETTEETEPSSAYTMNDDGYIVLGSYEQDGDESNGPEPLEWEIISEEDGRIFVMSRYCIEWLPYNAEEADVTWETSSIRSWLNGEFLDNSFSDEEQSRILTATVTTPDNPVSGVPGGNDTEDKVFLLSLNELIDNFEYEPFLEEDRFNDFPGLGAILTPYAQAESNSDYNDRCMWWLRSPGGNAQSVVVVDASGSAGWETGWLVNGYDSNGYFKFIRPAMYLEAE